MQYLERYDTESKLFPRRSYIVISDGKQKIRSSESVEVYLDRRVGKNSGRN